MTLNGVSFILIFGAVLAAVSFASAGFLADLVLKRPEIAPLVRFASLLIFGQAIFQSGIAALLGWSQMGDISITNVSQAILRLLVAVPLVVIGFAVYGALAGYVVSLCVAGIIALLMVLRKMKGARFRPLQSFTSDVRTMLAYSRTLFVGLFASNIMPQYVVVVLAAFAANSYVGFYQSANNYVTAITLTSGAMTQALFPAFAHLEGTKGDLKLAFAYAAKYMGFVLAPIIFFLMGASVQLIRVTLGSSYSVASGYLSLLAFANISILFGQGVLPSFFNGVGSPRYYMMFSLVAAGSLFALAPALSIGLGIGVPGLIYSILAANLIGVSVGLYLGRRHFAAQIDVKATLSILASSILAFLAVVPLETSHFDGVVLLLAEIAIFVAVYLTAAPILRALTTQDLEVLESAVAGLGRFKSLVLPILGYERFVILHTRGEGGSGQP